MSGFNSISNQSDEQLGWYIDNNDCEFFLPFVCHRCGRCCEAPAPTAVAGRLRTIADYIGTSVEELVAKRFKGMAKMQDRNSIKILDGWDFEPCPFLTEECQCEVYPARPEGCRLYPRKTDAGPGDIECLGDIEFKRVFEELKKRRIYFAAGSYPRGKRKPRRSEWRTILRKLKRGKPSSSMLERFISVNNIPEDLV